MGKGGKTAMTSAATATTNRICTWETSEVNKGKADNPRDFETPSSRHTEVVEVSEVLGVPPISMIQSSDHDHDFRPQT